MGNFYNDNDDLQFYVNHGINWQALVELLEPTLPATDGPHNLEEAIHSYREIVEMVGQFVADEVAPHVAAIDSKGVKLQNGHVVSPPELDTIFNQIKELGLHGMCLPRELGGMNCPVLLYFLSAELLGRADSSIMTHHGFHGAMALAMLLYSVSENTTTFDTKTGHIVKTRFAKEIAEIIAGEAWGCMDITEPNAGSDMAALATRAEQDEHGHWFVTGQKIFITSGHGKYHFVIARSEGTAEGPKASGLAGLSLFLVPTYQDNAKGERTWFARIDRLEEKLGHHASATCAISFEKSPAQLVGKRGEGFKHMLLLMNNARLGVGFEALGLCEAAYRLALDYAKERRSMGKTIDKHEILADYFDEMRTDIQGIRALCMEGAFQEEIATRQRMREATEHLSELEAKRARRIRQQAAAKARRITPLVKYLAAEKAVEMARRCLQIHGGVGYTQEYGAEKLLRDSLVTPIYEGTSQIQALMAMKDTLTGAMRNPQAFVTHIAQARWRSISSRDSLERRLAKLQSLSLSAVQHLLSKTATAKLKGLSNQPISQWPQTFFKNWNPKRDFAYAALHAERLTRIQADTAICEVLWQQAVKFPERREILERYIERAEPRCRFLYDEIVSTGERLLQTLQPEERTQNNDALSGARQSAS